MNIQFELWHGISLLVAILGGVALLGKIAIAQITRGEDVRHNMLGAQISKMEQAMRDESAHVAKQIDNQSGRISHLEARAEGVPTHGDLGDLYDKVHQVDNKVSSQGGKIDAIDATVRMILSRITENGMP